MSILTSLPTTDRYTSTFFDPPAVDKNEKFELNTLIDLAKGFIEEDSTPDGYNIGMNCGEAAGQTIFHFHCHVIPRFYGDMENPKGGIRHCVEGKGYY